MKSGKENHRCSFCGRDKNEAIILIAGIEGHICEVCVEQASEIIKDEIQGRSFKDIDGFTPPDNITPIQIKTYLDE